MIEGSTGPVLSAQHLTRAVDSRLLVDDVSLDVPRGEVVAVVGSSGAGKSSFLRLLNRLDEPTSGTVLLEGRDYREIPPAQLRRRAGMVLQSVWLFPGTVADNLRFGPRQRGLEPADAEVEGWLREVGLSGYSERDANTLSGGEAQRVSIARTLANSPELLLLDEPTSALDESSKQEIEMLVLRILREQRLTCVMVTHDMAQAGRMADRIMLMEHGRAVRIGDASEVLGAQQRLS